MLIVVFSSLVDIEVMFPNIGTSNSGLSFTRIVVFVTFGIIHCVPWQSVTLHSIATRAPSHARIVDCINAVGSEARRVTVTFSQHTIVEKAEMLSIYAHPYDILQA